jgi:hypothetical protein
MFVMPTPAEMIRRNQLLPPQFRQSAVMLQFSKPLASWMLDQFHRVHLTPEMLLGGEDGFFKAEVFQPQHVEPRACPRCDEMLLPVGENRSRCHNPRCRDARTGEPTSIKAFVTGPIRGVIKILTFPDHVADVVMKTTADGQRYRVEYFSACVLILDRRYRPEVLAAVYRTCGELCDQMGWGLK